MSRQRSARTEKAKEQTISKDSRGEQGATPMATATVAIGKQLKSAILGVAAQQEWWEEVAEAPSHAGRGEVKDKGELRLRNCGRLRRASKGKLQISHVARGPPGSHQSPRPSVSDILGQKALTLSTVALRLLVAKAQSKRPHALCYPLSLWLEIEDYKSCQVPGSLKPEQ